ncbi:MAG: ribulose-phosphate 3-epimerase [Brevinematia bacterium]
MRKIKVSPSIFAANFLNIEKEIEKLERLKVDYIHYDIMDNHFVPNISFGPLITKQIANSTSIPGDVHLMIDLSKERIQPFMEISNVEIITLHIEAPGFSRDLLNFVKSGGKKVGISIKPKTEPEKIKEFLEDIDLVLVMTVEPGFSGQKILPNSYSKVKEIKSILDDCNKNIYLEVDGGVNLENARLLIDNGANLLVIGSFFFANDNAKKIVEYLCSL